VSAVPDANDGLRLARANIRDVTKWLVTAFASLAAVIVGTGPLTSLGSLAPGMRLYLAIGAGLAGLTALILAIVLAVRLLVPKPFFLQDLVDDEALKSFIDGHANDLLPPKTPTVDELATERQRAALTAAGQDPDDAERPVTEEYRAEARKFLKDSQPYVSRAVDLAYFESQRRQFIALRGHLLLLTVCAVLGFGAFVWAATPPKVQECATPGNGLLRIL